MASWICLSTEYCTSGDTPHQSEQAGVGECASRVEISPSGGIQVPEHIQLKTHFNLFEGLYGTSLNYLYKSL